jgi:hypothetical protein
MKYLEWNNFLGKYFFRPENKGQIITLIISEEDIIQIGISSGTFSDGIESEKILESFKSEWRKGYPGTTGNMIEKINQEDCKGLSFYRTGRDNFKCMDIFVQYPPTFMHLIGINAAILKESNPSRYYRIRNYFRISEAEFPNMNEGLNWNEAWNNLIWWSNHFREGLLGLLPDKSLSSQRFEYMGKPYLFILLSKRELVEFYKYIFKKDVEPKSQISDEELIISFKQVKGNADILDLISSREETEVKQTVIAILRQLYSIWDGGFEVEGDLVKSFHQSRKLRLCFSINNITGFADFCFRFKEDIFCNSEITFNQEKITIHPNHWSSPIEINNNLENRIFQDNSIGLKVVFRPLEKKVFVFTNGRQEGLHSSIYIEADQIQHSGSQFLLLHSDLYPNLRDWLKSNGTNDRTEELLNEYFINNGFFLFSSDGFSQSFKGIDKLNLPANKTLHFSFGLKGNSFGKWISGFPVIGTLIGARGKEKLFLKGKDIYEFELIDSKYFKISNDVKSGSYQIEIVNDDESTDVPNGGQIEFTKLAFPLLTDNALSVYALNDENDIEEIQNYNSAQNVLNNVKGNYPTPPQFHIWNKENIKVEELETHLRAPVTFMEYLSYKGEMSKAEIGKSAATIFENYCVHEEHQVDVNKLNSYTINALRESCRVETLLNKEGLVSKVIPVKPFIFRLGNFQNFSISKQNTGMQPFIGALYALGGVYSFDLVRQLYAICKDKGALLNIYHEASSNALIPASIFIYSKKSEDAVASILDFLGQSKAYPYFNFIQPTATLLEKQENYCQSKQLDLHIETRYQRFNSFSMKFEKNVANTERCYPSLSLYEINPWEKYYILRFIKNDLKYNISVDPRWGKYILLYLYSINNLFYFDVDKNMLAIPSLLRLPVEFERNLFIFTGRIPANSWLIESDSELTYSQGFSKKGRSYLIYKGILKNTAERIANKLGQKINLKSIINP